MPKQHTFYVSGPITGIPDKNRAAFTKEVERLRALGFEVVNPAEIELGDDATWSDYMRADLIEMLTRCTAISMLPGWEKSRGAVLELQIARALGFEVTLAAGMSPFEVAA